MIQFQNSKKKGETHLDEIQESNNNSQRFQDLGHITMKTQHLSIAANNNLPMGSDHGFK